MLQRVEGILPDKVRILWNGLFRVPAGRRVETDVHTGGCVWQRVRRPAVPAPGQNVQMQCQRNPKESFICWFDWRLFSGL